MNTGKHLPIPGERYSHIKGGLYQIVTIAKHSETLEQLVIFQALFGSYEYYASPLDMFMGENDQGERWFNPVAGIEDIQNFYGEGMSETAAADENTQGSRSNRKPSVSEHIGKVAASDIFEQISIGNDKNRNSSRQSGDQGSDDFEAGYVDKKDLSGLSDRDFLFRILDCESSREMLELLRKNRDRLNNIMLGNIAAALDLIVNVENDEEIFVQIVQFLETRARFETDRLR